MITLPDNFSVRKRVYQLSYVDSNHDRQNQKLQCYHYTIRQSIAAKAEALNHATKLLTKSRTTKFFRVFNGTGAVAELRFYMIFRHVCGRVPLLRL